MDDGNGDAAGLSQADFRRMLAAPGAAAGGKPASTKRGALGAGHLFRPPRVKNRANEDDKNRQKHGVKQHHKQQQSQYRDRAAERRNGVGSEYEEGERLLQQLRDSATEEDSRQREYEQSKYLGGDIEHTHLVKGLDYLLLEKERARNGGEELDDELERLQKEGPQADSTCEAGKSEADAATATTPLGQRLMAALRQIGAAREEARRAIEVGFEADLNELFRPGRMYFDFASATPTTRIRNQDEIKKGFGASTADPVSPGDDAAVLRKVIASIAATWDKRSLPKPQHGSPKGRREKSGVELQQPAAGNKPAPLPVELDDDEDIFADAGTDYEVTVSNANASSDTAAGPPLPPDEGEPVVGPYPGSDSGQEEDVVGPYPGSDSDMDDDVVGPYPGGDSEDDNGVTGPYPGISQDPCSMEEEPDMDLSLRPGSRFRQEMQSLPNQTSSASLGTTDHLKRKANKDESLRHEQKRMHHDIHEEHSDGYGISRR